MSIKKKIKLLIIDDEKDICEFEKNYFDKRNLETHTAQDTKQAVILAKKVLPDIAIIDIHMRAESGIDILKKLLQVYSGCKCIMVTWDKEKAKEAKKLGAVDFVIKPVELSDLERSVNKIIKKIRKE